MATSLLFFAIVFHIALLLVLILKLRLHAFLSLLIVSISIGLFSGLSPDDLMNAIKNGMGGTLGFVALVVGLGAMFGAILEKSGGAQALAHFLLKRFGEKRTDQALMLTGFLVAIPVFFDVAFILLVPIIYAIQRKTGKSLLLYGIPLLAGLAITHSFIPPTPGPIAVADILGANLGWVIIFGFIIGLPAAILSGPVFARYISKKIQVAAPEINEAADENTGNLPSVLGVVLILLTPILLIVIKTLLESPWASSLDTDALFIQLFIILGHPFSALILANLLAWYFLGIRRSYSREDLLKISSSSLEPAGLIILLTGAGGVFKQMLVDTQIGEQMALFFSDMGLSIFVFAFISAALVRLLQGSATVAMITAAGLTAPMIGLDVNEMQKALLVLAIASGATIFSHVNDSGFWLVGKYLGLSEKQTFSSWTVMTGIIAFTGFIMVLILSLFV